MSILVLPKVWGFQEQLLPAQLNTALAAVALAVNNISNLQVALAAAIAGSKFSTMPGQRVTAAQIGGAQVTEPKLVDGNAFTEQAHDSETDASGAPIAIGTSKASLWATALNVRVGELVVARAAGQVSIPAAAGFDTTLTLTLERSDVPMGVAVPLRFERPGAGTAAMFPWEATLVGFQPDLGETAQQVYDVYAQQSGSTTATFEATNVGIHVLDAR